MKRFVDSADLIKTSILVSLLYLLQVHRELKGLDTPLTASQMRRQKNLSSVPLVLTSIAQLRVYCHGVQSAKTQNVIQFITLLT